MKIQNGLIELFLLWLLGALQLSPLPYTVFVVVLRLKLKMLQAHLMCLLTKFYI